MLGSEPQGHPRRGCFCEPEMLHCLLWLQGGNKIKHVHWLEDILIWEQGLGHFVATASISWARTGHFQRVSRFLPIKKHGWVFTTLGSIFWLELDQVSNQSKNCSKLQDLFIWFKQEGVFFFQNMSDCVGRSRAGRNGGTAEPLITSTSTF